MSLKPTAPNPSRWPMRIHPGVLLFLSVLLATSIGAHPAWAQFPRTVSYQGLLLTPAGTSVPDGNYDVTFKIYDAPSGANPPLWAEVHNGANQLATSKGIFSTILGIITPLNISFNGQLYMGITVGANPELTPRVQMTSAPQALTAQYLALPYSDTFTGGSVGMTLNTKSTSIYVHSTNGIGVSGESDVDRGVEGTSHGLSTNGYGVAGYAAPTSATGANAGVRALNYSTNANGYGVYAQHLGLGTASYGVSAGGVGVYGQSNGSGGSGSWGVFGEATTATASAPTVGVYGASRSTNQANSAGVWGDQSAGGDGVYGSSQTGNGIHGNSVSGVAVYGSTSNTAVGAKAIYGVLNTTNAGSNSVAVYGQNNGTGALGIGVWGTQGGSGWGVYGNTFSGRGVYGQSNIGYGLYGSSSSGYAGYFSGNVAITGTLNVTGAVTKGSGSFKIDHPLDPENKYLYHSFVESPDMKNIYDGNVVTDENGEATVELPGYFEALNKDFRYQLTPIGQFAQAMVEKKIEHNRFVIRTDKPNVEVSWMVTGIRHDATAVAHPMAVEVEKAKADRGYYLDPAAYGKSGDLGIEHARELREGQGNSAAEMAARTGGK